MRQDFDYVTMDDYSRDMAESASHAAGIIDAMKGQKRDVERMLIAAVLAAGGRVVVHAGKLIDADRALLRIERHEADDTIILTVHG